GAKAAVDVALHDLAARRARLSLPALLRSVYGAPGGDLPGGAVPSLVCTDVTLSAGDADQLAEAAAARVADGFGTLKLKVGTDAATDVARGRAVREAVGPEVVVRVDAKQGWTPIEAVEVMRALASADLGVEVVEQPVAGDDI